MLYTHGHAYVNTRHLPIRTPMRVSLRPVSGPGLSLVECNDDGDDDYGPVYGKNGRFSFLGELALARLSLMHLEMTLGDCSFLLRGFIRTLTIILHNLFGLRLGNGCRRHTRPLFF